MLKVCTFLAVLAAVSISMYHQYHQVWYKHTRATPVTRNWDGMFAFTPELGVVYPESEQEIVDFLRSTNASVKVVGAGHSWSDIAVPTHYQMSLDKLNKVLEVHPHRRVVVVQAGIRLIDLCNELAKHGVALANVPSVLEQSIAGAISTGTHGSGLGHGSLSSMVEAVTIITADGTVIKASRSVNMDVYEAARLGLGAIGILTEVTLRIVPAFGVKSVQYIADTEWAFTNLIQLATEHEFFKMWTIPYSNKTLIYEVNRIAEDPEAAVKPYDPYFPTAYDEAQAYIIESVQWLSRYYPKAIHSVHKAMAAVGFPNRTLVGRSDSVLTVPWRLPYHTEMEYVVPAHNATRVLREWDRLNWELPVYLTNNFVAEVRFAASDDVWMSNSYGRDTCHITVGRFHALELEIKEYFTAFEAIARKHGGRPHWAKRFYSTADELKEMYPKWDDFQAVRQQMDPTGRFLNGYLKRILGVNVAAQTIAPQQATPQQQDQTVIEGGGNVKFD